MFFLLVFSGILIVVLFSFWGEGGGGEIFVQSECHRCTDYISENVFIGNGSCVLIFTFFWFHFWRVCGQLLFVCRGSWLVVDFVVVWCLCLCTCMCLLERNNFVEYYLSLRAALTVSKYIFSSLLPGGRNSEVIRCHGETRTSSRYRLVDSDPWPHHCRGTIQHHSVCRWWCHHYHWWCPVWWCVGLLGPVQHAVLHIPGTLSVQFTLDSCCRKSLWAWWELWIT